MEARRAWGWPLADPQPQVGDENPEERLSDDKDGGVLSKGKEGPSIILSG